MRHTAESEKNYFTQRRKSQYAQTILVTCGEGRVKYSDKLYVVRHL